MSVVIFKWNPGFSSYTMSRFLTDLEKCALANSGDIGMNWSIRDYDRVKKGDTCYLLKVGYGQTGIVACGTVTSDSYSDEDWSWRNRPTKYCDFKFEVMINPDAYPILDSKSLSQTIPDFDWTGGPSGLVLTESQAQSLEALWSNYMQRQAEYFEKASDQNLFVELPSELTGTVPYTMELGESYNGQKITLKFVEGEIVCCLRILNYYRTLKKFEVRSWRALRHLFMQQYPSTENLSLLCADLFRHRIEYTTDFYKLSDDDETD